MNNRLLDQESGEVIPTCQRLNIAGDAMVLGTADYPRAQRDLFRWLYGYAKDNQWNWGDLHSAVRLNSTQLYHIWNGSQGQRGGKPTELAAAAKKIERFKERAEKQAAATRLPFAETSVFERISTVCDEALTCQTIAMVYGESQIGKTASLKEYARRHNHGQTVYVLMPASAGVQSMMRAIAESCYISTRTCFENLRSRVTRYLDDSKLLIIDEVHEAFVSYHRQATVKCMSVLRQLQEQTGCGMVLCGTNVFRNQIERGEFAQSLKQLRKRGIWELQLEDTPTAGDIALIYSHYGLPKPKGGNATLVEAVCKKHGLGKFTKFMARAAQKAAKQREKFQWKHYEAVIAAANALVRAPETKK